MSSPAIDLAALRKRRHHTQAAVAEALGVSQSYISQLERGSDPHLSSVIRYVQALGGQVEIAAVFDGEHIPVT